MIHSLKYCLSIFVYLFSLSLLPAQNKELGIQYYNEKKYPQAIEELEKVYKKYPDERIYGLLHSAYINTQNYKQALKLSDNPPPALLKIVSDVDKAYVLSLMKEDKKSEKLIQEILNALPPNQDIILKIAHKFFAYKWYNHTENTYLKGQKALHNYYNFAFELSEVYAATGNITKMASALLSALEYGSDYLEAVKNAMGTFLYDDANGKIQQTFKQECLKIAQAKPNDTQYMEMLIWLYLQENNYAQAFTFSKTLDKRKKEDGKRFIDLALMARNNEDYALAAQCYGYIIDKDEKNYYYRLAKIEWVNVLQEQMAHQAFLDEGTIKNLQKSYEKALEDLGYSEMTAELIINYARLLAFQINDVPKALEYLNELQKNPSIPKQAKAKAKLLKGDIYILKDDIWEAILLYGQVNTDFKQHPIGFEAKLKSAKAYYFTGDFDWAKTQLDVIKAATSKLIANDAIILSVLISDHLGMDTTRVPLEMFARADFMYYQQKYAEALAILQGIPILYPHHLSILDDVYFLQAKIYLQQQLIPQAITYLEKAVAYQDLLADDALLLLAKIYEDQLKEIQKAMVYYEKIIIDHPDSVHAVYARKKYRALRGT